MNFNWLDIVIGAVLFISVLGAVRNGATKEILRIASLAVGIFLAMWWYDRLAIELQPFIEEPRLASGAAFVLILVGSLIAGAFFAWTLIKLWGITGLRWFDRLLGGAFGLLRGTLVAGAVLLVVVPFSPVPSTSRTVADSKLAPWVLNGAQVAAATAPEDFRDAFADGFDRVQAAWTGDRR